MPLPCVVYNTTGPIQVRWYHSQNGNPADAEELTITAGGRYTVEESEQNSSASSRYTSCTEGDQLYRNTLKFNYSEGDSGSYWCRIVIGGDILLEFSEAWTVLTISTSGPTTCGTGPSQTDPKCAGQITPTLASTTMHVQSTPTSVWKGEREYILSLCRNCSLESNLTTTVLTNLINQLVILLFLTNNFLDVHLFSGFSNTQQCR